MIQIRKNTFETNSSSSHSLVISTEKEFAAFKAGILYEYVGNVYDLPTARDHVEKFYPEKLAELDEDIRFKDYEGIASLLDDCEVRSYDYWKDNIDNLGMETYVKHFTSPSGDKLVAWGHYGYNG